MCSWLSRWKPGSLERKGLRPSIWSFNSFHHTQPFITLRTRSPPRDLRAVLVRLQSPNLTRGPLSSLRKKPVIDKVQGCCVSWSKPPSLQLLFLFSGKLLLYLLSCQCIFDGFFCYRIITYLSFNHSLVPHWQVYAGSRCCVACANVRVTLFIAGTLNNLHCYCYHFLRVFSCASVLIDAIFYVVFFMPHFYKGSAK